MFENFTESARRAMDLASREAVKPDNPFLGTEHILVGILQEGECAAAVLLKNANVDVIRVQQQIRQLIPPDDSPAYWVGKRPLSPGAKQAIKLAGEAATRLRHDAIETEHLLLGLLKANKGFAPQVLMNLGLKLEEFQDRVLKKLRGNAPEDIGSA